MKNIFLNTVKFILALSGIFLLLELFVFNAGISRRSEVSFSEELGKYYAPDYNYTWFSEGYSMGSVNEGGYLGPYYENQKKPQIQRVALLGDSYVEGFQVFDRNHFRSILEKQLNSDVLDSIEVLNFGRSNFNFPNMFAYQNLVVQEYRPDLTLFFISREDLTSLTTDILLPNVLPTSLDVTPYLSNETVGGFFKANHILSSSSLAYMLNSARRSVQNRGVVNSIFDGKFSDSPIPEQQEQLIQPINLKLFERLDKENVIFVYREKKPLTENLKLAIENAGILLIDLSYLLVELEKSGQNPNAWFNQKTDGHWNIIGHKAVGTYLASAIASELE
jgi:hypothetical protein